MLWLDRNCYTIRIEDINNEKNKEWVDPLVEEVRQRGRAFTAKFNNDSKKIFDYLNNVHEKNVKILGRKSTKKAS